MSSIYLSWRVIGLFFALIVVSAVLAGCGASERSPGEISLIRGTSFVETDHVWVLMDDGDLLHTTDGGATWVKVSGGRPDLDQVFFQNAHSGLAVTEGGEVLGSSDSGRTWNTVGRIESPPGTRFSNPGQLFFVDELNGWVIDNYSVWTTADGGKRWGRYFPTTDIEFEGQPAQHFYLNQNSRWIVASNGLIYHTTDGGRSWRKAVIPTKPDLKAVFFTDERTGWIGGWPRGGIYVTRDGGLTWQHQFQQNEDNNIGINALYFANESEGWAVGRKWPKRITEEPSAGVVLRTTDGGQSWTPVHLDNGEFFYTQIHFTDDEHGWLVGRSGLYRTEDGGVSWRNVLKAPSVK